MAKYLFTIDYMRVSYTTSHKDGSTSLDFNKSEAGKMLRKKLKEVGIDQKDVETSFVYRKVPEPKNTNKQGNPISYKDPKLKEARPFMDELQDKIIEEKPEVVVPNGKLGCKMLLDKVAISKLRGVPEQVTLENDTDSHTFWVLPIYSMEYMIASPNVEYAVNSDLQFLKQYDEQGEEAFTPSEVQYEYVGDFNRVKEIFSYLRREKPVTAWDLETNTLSAHLEGAKALVLTLSWEEQQGVTIPLEHKESPWNDSQIQQILEYLEEMLADPSHWKVFQGGKFDIRFLMGCYGFKEFESNMDTKVAYYLTVNQDVKTSFKLTDLTYEFTDMGGYDRPLEQFKNDYIKDYKKEHKENPVNEIDGSNFNYNWIPMEILHPYAAGDVDATIRIYNQLWKKVKTRDKWIKLFTEHYPRLTRTLAKVELNGLTVDLEYAEDMDVEYEKEEERLLNSIREIPSIQELEDEHRQLYEAGLEEMKKPKSERDEGVAKFRNKYKNKLEFNPNSSEDKGRVLYDILGLRLPVNKFVAKDDAVNKRYKPDNMKWDMYRSNKDALNEIVDGDYPQEAKDLAGLLLQHSSIKTRRNTYTKKYPKLVDKRTNKIHGTFNETGTETSRLSSAKPNIQNIPSAHQDVNRFDYNYPVKRMFVSQFEGGVIQNFDYSALEIRILALRANDETMIQSFLDGEDTHKQTASIIFNKPQEEITKDERSASKAVSFGIVYGKSIKGLSEDLGITKEEAEDIQNRFMATKPNVKKFIEDTHEFLEENGFVETMQGHRRNMKDVWGDNFNRSEAFRQSVNTVIQGSGSYLTNTAMILIADYLRINKMKSELIATVHDSLVLDVHPDEITHLAYVVPYIMEHPLIDFLNIEWKGEEVQFPVSADAEIGLNYNDMVEYDREEFMTFQSAEGYIKYHRDLQKIEDYFQSELIPKEAYEQGTESVKAQKQLYQNI